MNNLINKTIRGSDTIFFSIATIETFALVIFSMYSIYARPCVYWVMHARSRYWNRYRDPDGFILKIYRILAWNCVLMKSWTLVFERNIEYFSCRPRNQISNNFQRKWVFWVISQSRAHCIYVIWTNIGKKCLIYSQYFNFTSALREVVLVFNHSMSRQLINYAWDVPGVNFPRINNIQELTKMLWEVKSLYFVVVIVDNLFLLCLGLS